MLGLRDVAYGTRANRESKLEMASECSCLSLASLHLPRTTTCRTPFVAWVGALRKAAPEPDNTRQPHVFQTLVRVLSDNCEAALRDDTPVYWTVIVDADW